jgi:hypothetical protein
MDWKKGHKEVCGSAEKPDEKKPDEKKPDEPIPSADAPADKMPNEPTLSADAPADKMPDEPTPSADAPAVKKRRFVMMVDGVKHYLKKGEKRPTPAPTTAEESDSTPDDVASACSSAFRRGRSTFERPKDDTPTASPAKRVKRGDEK